MSCKKCIESPVIKLTNSPVSLCKSCFIKYFEKKVKKTISDYKQVFLENSKINLGFTSRGCIRKCEFCLSPDTKILMSDMSIKKIKEYI